jgi:hypothetical protein
MSIKISLSISHTPWRPERVAALRVMLGELGAPPGPFWINDRRATRPWQEFKTEWALEQWEWHLSTDATHHLLCTDDLHLAPCFVDCLEAMIEAAPEYVIGLLANHPKAVELFRDGWSWYRTNSWVVGPAYVLPRRFLEEFLVWRKALPPGNNEGCADWYNDDSSINAFVTMSGRTAAHPLPTIIEHRTDVESTVGHGDQYSRERLSWRKAFSHHTMASVLRGVDYWQERGGPDAAPLLVLPGLEGT